ncbi:MAG: serine protease [Gammaproteobacteria bacterium]|nr:MAG: serine protease [Gammaproteobacteria bacterium]
MTQRVQGLPFLQFIKLLWLPSAILWSCLPLRLQAEPVTAEDLYRNLQDRIYQIQVIDVASDKKSSLGSGFLISDDGLIATNYHVVADFIHTPDKYRIEYLDTGGNRGALSIRDIDIVHDLAIVSADITGKQHLQLSGSRLAKGARIFAIGNPHDLGMSIVEGTFNGLLEKSIYERILFSGSLNPGMSGGPALDQQGKVIGINVATAGNDLSFLVPVRYLKAMLDDEKPLSNDDLISRIGDQLYDNQQSIMAQIFSAQWKTMTLGDAVLPAELADYFKCWGKSDTDKEKLYDHTYSACASPDSIYVSQQLNTASVDFRYDWYHGHGLNGLQFYNLLSEKFAGSFSTNRAGKEDVTNYQCNTRFVTVADRTWKAALCLRQYKKFPRLYDLSLSMAQVEFDTRGLLVNINASGVSQDNAFDLVRRFLESIQ